MSKLTVCRTNVKMLEKLLQLLTGKGRRATTKLRDRKRLNRERPQYAQAHVRPRRPMACRFKSRRTLCYWPLNLENLFFFFFLLQEDCHFYIQKMELN
ncbi:hypothetical protein CEXT_658821 [Caerostris extrusa]|uniref:Uncharacterized protein n=1 Tax=Caerostris extrusa TaxID=172846 RepID=A0AAV4WJR6_CAEEX|nr:hypothetical protein CEXT_658821 [Caerostris extrusa]